jgi:hypothetical protein
LFAEENNLLYMETSAKTNVNVEKVSPHAALSAQLWHSMSQAFLQVAERIYDKVSQGIYDATLKVNGHRSPGYFAAEARDPQGNGESLGVWNAPQKAARKSTGGCC